MTFQENTILNNIERHCEMRDRFRHIGIICLHNQVTVMITSSGSSNRIDKHLIETILYPVILLCRLRTVSVVIIHLIGSGKEQTVVIVSES